MRIWLLLLALLCACVPTRAYRLPLAPAHARATFAPIISRATELGLRAAEEGDAVLVQPDEGTSIRFTIRDDRYEMVIRIDVPGMTAAKAERRFARAVRVGRRIWRTALAGMAASAAPVPK